MGSRLHAETHDRTHEPFPSGAEERREAHQTDHGPDRKGPHAPSPACLPLGDVRPRLRIHRLAPPASHDRDPDLVLRGTITLAKRRGRERQQAAEALALPGHRPEQPVSRRAAHTLCRTECYAAQMSRLPTPPPRCSKPTSSAEGTDAQISQQTQSCIWGSASKTQVTRAKIRLSKEEPLRQPLHANYLRQLAR